MTKINFQKYIALIICLILFQTHVLPQNEVSDQNKELSNIRTRLIALENKLKEIKLDQKENLSELEIINEKVHLIDKLVEELAKEEKVIEKRISKAEKEKNNLQENLEVIQRNYSKYVVWLYKQQDKNMITYLFNSESIDQAIVRYKYFNDLTEKSSKTKNEILTKKDELNKLTKNLESERKSKIALIAEKNDEQTRLSSLRDEKQNLISSLRKNSDLIEVEIVEKKKAEIRIKNLINELIEKERNRLAKLKEAELKNEEPAPEIVKYDYATLENFIDLKGRMNWPTRKGNVKRKFGENKNERLKTVTLNYGIDISTDKNSEVYAVADGYVSAIQWIPGYGSVVIITHTNDYRTVYGHLANIQLNESQRVKGGDLIGYVNESLEGNIIHFEVWNDRNYQNPEIWLSRK